MLGASLLCAAPIVSCALGYSPDATIAFHPGPPFYLQFEVDAGEVRLMFSGEQRPLGPFLGFKDPFAIPLSIEDEAWLMGRARELFSERAVLTIDGVAVQPILDAVQAFDGFGPGNPEPSLQFDLRYPCEGTASTVHVNWSIFEADSDQGVPTLFRQVDGFFEFTAIHADEPEYTWHGRNQSLAGVGSTLPSVPAAPPQVTTYPILSLTLVLCAALASPFLRRESQRRALTGLWAAALLGAIGLRGIGSTPPWGGAVLMPSHTQALAMFTQLHANIYRAMGAHNPDEVYAVLASSVDADQLDELYAEVYESLVLREDGGAFCTIDEVEPVSSVFHMPDEVNSESDLVFEVDWSWNVRGTVVHHAHSHERLNAYRALYTVGYDGEAWRIASWEVLAHSRVDDGGALEVIVEDEAGAGDGDGQVSQVGEGSD